MMARPCKGSSSSMRRLACLSRNIIHTRLQRKFFSSIIWIRILPRSVSLSSIKFSKSIDEQLYKDAESKIHYMDFETLEVRLNALLSRGSFGNSRYALASSAALPTSHSEQLGIEVTDSSVQNGRAVPGSINPPLPARDITCNVLYSQGPESSATAAPCVSSLLECSPLIAGDFSGGVPTGHTKYNFPGDVNQVDSQQPSTSGSSSSVSAMCDRTANSANNNRYSAGQVSPVVSWSHPIEQSDQSNITAEAMTCISMTNLKCALTSRECGLEGCMQMNGTCFAGEMLNCKHKIHIIRQKRLKINSPRSIHADKTKFPKELQHAANGTYVSSETVQSGTTALPTKSPSGCSLLDINASNNMEVIRLPETAVQAEEGLCQGNADIEVKELSCYGNDIEMKDAKLSSEDQTSLVASLTATKKRGGSILYALTAEELGDHMKSLNQHICLSQVMTEEHPSGLPDQNTCNLCGMERILFEPPPRFCALCFKIINSTGSYYVHVENGIDKASICAKCHHLSTAKVKYQKRLNYAETDAEAEWVEYTCAKCLLKEKDSGDIVLLESPTVPGVEGLTVRVVSSAARVLQVQPLFREFFKEGKYPGEFPYKSKPTTKSKHVYLAYIDSVKYFRPEIKSASGEALRTFVYHEILIGYLDYCKKQGFVSCSIWACPSTKRDDYVLYCHHVTKMPKSDKLELNLIKKAVKDGVVVGVIHCMTSSFSLPVSIRPVYLQRACHTVRMISGLEKQRLLEKKGDNTSQKKEPQVGRLIRVAKRDDRKGNLEDNLEDILLVHKVSSLEKRSRTMKEDFIMLSLQRFCKHCHQPIVSGKSWVCTVCKNFHLCDHLFCLSPCHGSTLCVAVPDLCGCKFCDSCYKQGGEKLHIHKLKQADNQQVLPNYTLQDYLEGLVHSSKCFCAARNCSFKLCFIMKKLFFHGVRCDIRNRGGCQKCIFMWKLLLTHAKHCSDMECSVPRCRDIKAFFTRKTTRMIAGPPCAVEC
ncbi:hypothetical protein ZWY2020_011244 [Hordeum vulgare]|nr:hypothetical protein ZWY2020_011244 [Hordeum vulgare]